MIDAVQILNSNKIVMGITMLIVNMGSRYVLSDLSPAHERLLSHVVFKRVVVFCMFFVTTRDIVVSVCMTAAFLFLFNVLLHENSQYCILPWSLRAETASKPGNATSSSSSRAMAREQWYRRMAAENATRDRRSASSSDPASDGTGHRDNYDEGAGEEEFVSHASAEQARALLDVYERARIREDEEAHPDEKVDTYTALPPTENPVPSLGGDGYYDEGIEGYEEGGEKQEEDPLTDDAGDPLPYAGGMPDDDDNDITRSSTLAFVNFLPVTSDST